MLKLRNEDDQEPRLFRQLEATGVYPKVHAASTCECHGTRGTGHAWVVDGAKPHTVDLCVYLRSTERDGQEVVSYAIHPEIP